jgi:hypothetical protein
MGTEIHLVFYELADEWPVLGEPEDWLENLKGTSLEGRGFITAPASWPPPDPTGEERWEAGDADGEDRHWVPVRHVTLPGDKESVLSLVDALLFVQRRTHEHDWQGPDDGLEGLEWMED